MKNLFMVPAIVTLIFSGSAFPQQKATIAVGGIEYRAKDSAENKHYRAYGQDPREDTRAFVDMLTTALVKTKKFDVIERERMSEVLKEQGLSLEGIAKGGYEGDGLNLKGIDYILTGAITEYGTISKGVQFRSFATAGDSAVMAVDIRVLEVATGSIGIAESVRAQASGGGAFEVEGFATGAESDSSAQLGEVMRKAARNATNLIVSTIYPIKVVTIDKNGDAMLNYGDSLLQEGDVEYFPIEKIKGRTKYEISSPNADNEMKQKWDEFREKLENTKSGIYIFYDSSGRAIYVGKTSAKSSLWARMKSSFNHDQQKSRQLYRIDHGPNAKPLDQKLGPKPVQLHELARYFSAYEVDKHFTHNIEALLIRAFADNLMNKKMVTTHPPVRHSCEGRKPVNNIVAAGDTL